MISSQHANLQRVDSPARHATFVEETTLSGSRHDAIVTFGMVGGLGYGLHQHDCHQILWSPDGILAAEAGGRVWMLNSDQALWVPPQVEHDVSALGSATLRSLYMEWRDRRPGLEEPTVIHITELLRGVINQLADGLLDSVERENLETVLFDCLRRAGEQYASLPIPVDDRSRRVALAVLANPQDQRTLQMWGESFGASSRTLSRLFRSETGLTFDEWRRQARMNIALTLLASGTQVETCAQLVGYNSSSSFGAAFRQAFGRTPSTGY